MTVREFAQNHGITATSEPVDRNPHIQDNWQANHYRVTLRMERKRMTTYFSMGLGLRGEPTVEDVLDCLANDAASVENAPTFEDWARDLGYDTDSRKAEKTYRACKKEAERLRTFLGTELYEELLWHVERL